MGRRHRDTARLGSISYTCFSSSKQMAQTYSIVRGGVLAIYIAFSAKWGKNIRASSIQLGLA